MISVILHSILALLTAGAAGAAYRAWRKKGFRDCAIKDLFYFFLFFSAAHLSVVVSFFLLFANPAALAWGYIFMVGFIFAAVFCIFKIEFGIMRLCREKTRFLLAAVIFSGAVAVVIQAYDFRLPIAREAGFILWNANLVSAWMTSLPAASAAMLWIVLFMKNFPENMALGDRLKFYFSVIDSIFFVGAALTYFPARDNDQIVLSFVFIFLGTFFASAPFVFSKIRFLATGK